MCIGFGFLNKIESFLNPTFLYKWSCYLASVFLGFSPIFISLSKNILRDMIGYKVYHSSEEHRTVTFKLTWFIFILRDTFLGVFKDHRIWIRFHFLENFEFFN